MTSWLRAPDPAGRDLALLRTRLYRFSDDLRWYVLAETLEEHFLDGQPPAASTLAKVRACLTQIRQTGQPPAFDGEPADCEGADIAAGLRDGAGDQWHRIPLTPRPARLVLIVSAPRSGTSHLLNLLATTGAFGYLTTASCWAWPVRNLRHPRRRLFTELGSEIFTVAPRTDHAR